MTKSKTKVAIARLDIREFKESIYEKDRDVMISMIIPSIVHFPSTKNIKKDCKIITVYKSLYKIYNFRHFLLMPFFFMDYKDPSYNVRKFSHRLRGTYDWLVNLFDFAVRINENIKETLSPVLSDFDYVDYNAKSSMSLTDMPLSIYVPLSQNNEVYYLS